MSLYPLSNTWDTKYVTVSNTWARKDTVASYLTKYTLCNADDLSNIFSGEKFSPGTSCPRREKGRRRCRMRRGAARWWGSPRPRWGRSWRAWAPAWSRRRRGIPCRAGCWCSHRRPPPSRHHPSSPSLEICKLMFQSFEERLNINCGQIWKINCEKVLIINWENISKIDPEKNMKFDLGKTF